MALIDGLLGEKVWGSNPVGGDAAIARVQRAILAALSPTRALRGHHPQGTPFALHERLARTRRALGKCGQFALRRIRC